jgi:phosphoribosylglycinamide formyltransferase-1
MTGPLRLGVIGSSGGSALAAADECLRAVGRRIAWVVVTDRDCGMLRWAREHAHIGTRLPYESAEAFSALATRALRAQGCADVLLFYTRRVAAPLIDELRVCNIHPSLLPAFPGLDALGQARAAGVRVFGATLHAVDAGIDTGPIVAQVADAFPDGMAPGTVEHRSFVQKVWLCLVWYERCVAQTGTRELAHLPGGAIGLGSPDLASSELRQAFSDWSIRQRTAGVVAQ